MATIETLLSNETIEMTRKWRFKFNAIIVKIGSKELAVGFSRCSSLVVLKKYWELLYLKTSNHG
jgi:hypothetical protein